MRNVTPTMVEALNIVAKTGLTEGVRATTIKALVNRELIWDDNGAWYLTSEAHDLDGVNGDAREADLARQEARFQASEEQAEPAEIGTAVHALTERYTYLADDQLQDRVTDAMTKAVAATKQVTEVISNTARQAARALVPVAYAGYVAVVRSMGRTVRGKVVDADLRAADRNGANRVLLVVEHPNGAPGRKATRTLHALVDVKLEPVAS